jgi:type III secretion protein C
MRFFAQAKTEKQKRLFEKGKGDYDVLAWRERGSQMKRICLTILFLFAVTLHAEEETHHINFSDVPAIEFIRFVSKISEANFIYDHCELGFNISLSSGKPMTSNEVVDALIEMLRMHGFAVSEEENYFVVHRYSDEDLKNGVHLQPRVKPPLGGLIAEEIFNTPSKQFEFATYKLRYHKGDEIEGALKKIATDMSQRKTKPSELIEAIQTIQWVQATNSFFFSGSKNTVEHIDRLIQTLDVPRKQVFIEVLVVETDARNTNEFGLEWTGGGKFKDKIAFGSGNFSGKENGFADVASTVNSGSPLKGLSQIPIGRCFDLGIIGDIIRHKGKIFLTLGSLVSALEHDRDSTIILNQKIIAQDNKNSRIFVGDNLPFTGSIVSTVGASQQTTANVKYLDVGVALSVTPIVGNDDDNLITLDIDQQITEAIDDPISSSSEVEGIRTTKANMTTLAHVPDNHFLALSGMGRKAKSIQRIGIPCLGGLPVIGGAFSKNKRMSQERNVLIFVRPHIISKYEEWEKWTQAQEGYCKVPKEVCYPEEA